MIKTAVVISDESKDDEVGMFNTVDVILRMMMRLRHTRLSQP